MKDLGPVSRQDSSLIAQFPGISFALFCGCSFCALCVLSRLFHSVTPAPAFSHPTLLYLFAAIPANPVSRSFDAQREPRLNTAFRLVEVVDLFYLRAARSTNAAPLRPIQRLKLPKGPDAVGGLLD
jgi:hypothetical protein